MRPLYLKSIAALAVIAVAALLGGGSALGASADVAVTVSDGAPSEIPGTQVSYTITVTNPGSSNVKKVTVKDTFPSTLTGVTWSCVPGAGAACAAASGSGSIDTMVDVASGTSAVFTATGTIAPSAFPTLSDTATVAVPRGSTDPTPANNTSTDTDDLIPNADLTLDSGVLTSPTPVFPSTTPTVYGNSTASQNTLVFSVKFHNQGPSDARHTTLRFSPLLSDKLGNADWCKVTANVNCTQNNQFSAYVDGADVGQLAPGPDPDQCDRSRARAGERPRRSDHRFAAVHAVRACSHRRPRRFEQQRPQSSPVVRDRHGALAGAGAAGASRQRQRGRHLASPR